MATYPTQASFMLSCTPEQATTALDALNHIQGDISDLAAALLPLEAGHNLSPLETIIWHCVRHHRDQMPDLSQFDLDWCFHVEDQDNGLWFTGNDDRHIELGDAAVFMQAVMIAFDLDTQVVITAAKTASKPVLNAFSGSVLSVTKDHCRYHDLQPFVDAEQEAHQSGRSFYVCTVHEALPEHTVSRHVLLTGSQSISAKSIGALYLVSLDPAIPPPCDPALETRLLAGGRTVTLGACQELSPYEFAVMAAHLPVFNPDTAMSDRGRAKS